MHLNFDLTNISCTDTTISTSIQQNVLKGKLYAKRRIGRPRLRWTDDVTDDLRKMGLTGWPEKARYRDQWRLIFKEAKAHPGQKK
jgi:hypothetical protein